MVLQLGEKEKLVVVGASGGIATGIYNNPMFQQALADFEVAALLNSSHVTYNPELAQQIAQSGDKDHNKGLLNDKGGNY
ncbi:hypothetical protein LR010_00330, partial [Candidatus Gracilibacteria bacterium]|nr:hypothetical protein [Candidatus Gracilibacteria bacterium]